MTEFRIERSLGEDGAAVAEVIRRVWEQVEKKEWFIADDADYVTGILRSGRSIAYQAIEIESGETAGVFVAVFPGAKEENLGRDIGLPEEKLSLVAHMDSVAVLPKYRGNRLQYRLMQEMERELRILGYEYLMCTVHPENKFSRDNILRQGYEVAMTKEKYGGYPRDILLKRIVQ